MRGTCLALLTLLSLSGSCVAAPAKKLIEMGWDEPDPAFLRAHLAEVEASPFDGVIYHLPYRLADGSAGDFTWKAWGKRAFTEQDVAAALADLEATPFRRLQHNFLRFNVTPADLDWFDDFGAVIQNAELAASVARRGGSKGIAFDTEQYAAKLFTYPKQRDAATRSWSEYAAQARRRGGEVMAAFQRGYPGLTIFFTFAYSLPWMETAWDKRPIEACRNGLLVPFLDGMVDSARAGTRLVDGYEMSYGERDTAKFEAAYRLMKRDLLGMVADSVKYRRVFSAAFGVRVDQGKDKTAWHPEDPEKNYFPPGKFETVVRKALERSDEYVWIYGETPRWWSKEGRPHDLPAAYDRALRAAQGSRAR